MIKVILFVDSSEWNDTDYVFISDDPIRFLNTFEFKKQQLSDDSLVFRMNTDCNDNGRWDDSELTGVDYNGNGIYEVLYEYNDNNNNGFYDAGDDIIQDYDGNDTISVAYEFVEITGVTALERTTFDTAYIEGGVVTLVNPIITPGSGDILSLQLFNNVGVETSVHVTYNMCIGYTSDGSEVGIGIQDDANYQIQGVDQYFIVQSGNGTIGGGASILVSLANTVPIALTMLEISNTPEILIPSAEPFSDVNENGEYDLGEPFTDWNQNGQWSPIIEQIGLSEDWNVDITVVGSNLIINMVNWNNPLEPNSNELFRVNYLVNDEAMINDMTTISTNAGAKSKSNCNSLSSKSLSIPIDNDP